VGNSVGIRGTNKGENKDQQLFQGGGWESLAVRAEMAFNISSWHLAYRAFSSKSFVSSISAFFSMCIKFS